MMSNIDYITTGDIARMLRCPLHRVTYAIQRLGLIEDARAGGYRLFRRERLPQIVAEITRLREGRPKEGLDS